MNKIRVVSDGTTEGTKVLRPDGTDVAAGAYAVQVNIGQEGPPHVVITFLLGGMESTASDSFVLETSAQDAAVAAHNARKL